MLIKGILHFPTLFTAKKAQGADVAKFSAGVLVRPGDPQIAAVQAEVNTAKANTFPSGYTGADECFNLYEVKIPPSKEYHDPRFVGWYLFTSTAQEADRPPVVKEGSLEPVINPSDVYSGMVAYLNAGITGYVKGKGGVGGWLNGVMITAEDPPMGRLDNKPSVEQMFAQVGATHTTPPVQTGNAPLPPAAPLPAAPVATPQHVMTASAGGATYETMIAAGWTDESMVTAGHMLPPTPVAPSFT